MENSPGSSPWYAGGGGDTGNGDTTERPLLEQAKEQTQQVIQQTQQKAGEAVDRARTQVKSQIESQKERATGRLETVALALRQTGDHLREQDQQALGQYADGAAEAVERFSEYLRQKDLDQLVGGVEDFARRQPAVFLGGTFALGFLAARFLKSSGRNGETAAARAMPSDRYAAHPGGREYPGVRPPLPAPDVGEIGTPAADTLP